MTKKKKKNLQFEIITIFPDIFNNYFSTSIIKRAQNKGLIKIKIHNLRDWATDKHRTVDDKPYGGGPGMILKADVIWRAIAALAKTKNKKPKIKNTNKKIKKQRIILLTPAGKQFNQKITYQYSKLDRLILICGHYEGVDARVEKFVDEKVSIGPYVLTGGELPAMVIVDAVTRLIPGVIRKESLAEESFSLPVSNIQYPTSSIEYPQYTRPRVLTIKNKYGRIKVLKVPKVLLSGNHQKIKEWRLKQITKHK
ncbi:MAG: tRNA (guanosine(37)-N1)-methyltransferase TrmD [Patescibacteria group bacterium]